MKLENILLKFDFTENVMLKMKKLKTMQLLP